MSKILHGANMEINFYPHSKWLKGSDFHGYVCEICNSVWIYNLAQLLGKSWYQSDGRKEDSPLVINPLWSVSSFRNSSRISCSSFWSNAPISGWTIKIQNHQKYLINSTSPSPLMAIHNLLNSEKSIFSLPSLSAWYDSAAIIKDSAAGDVLDDKVNDPSADVLNDNNNEQRDDYYLTYQAPCLPLCHTPPNLCTTHWHWHSTTASSLPFQNW